MTARTSRDSGEKYGDGYPFTLFEDDARTYRPVYEALASWREDHVEYFGSGAHALLQAARLVGVNLTDYVSLADLAEIRSRADSYEKRCDEECSPGSAPYHQPDIQSDGE